MGRPYHPNKAITWSKIFRKKKFSIYIDWPDMIKIYNDNKHNSTKFKQNNYLFNLILMIKILYKIF